MKVKRLVRLAVVSDRGRKRIVLRGQRIGIQLVGVPVDAEAAAEHGSLRGPIGEAKPRRPVVVGWINEFEARCRLELRRRRSGGCRNQCSVGRIQNSRVAIQAVRHGGQFVAQAIIQRELRHHLPVVQHEKAIPPFTDRSFGGEDRTWWTTEQGPARNRPRHSPCWYSLHRRCPEFLEIEQAARIVGRFTADGELAQLEAGHDVVAAAGPAQLVVAVDRAIVLVPVGAACCPASGRRRCPAHRHRSTVSRGCRKEYRN